MKVQQRNDTIFYTLRNIPKGPNEGRAANLSRIVFFDARAAVLSVAGKPRAGFFDPTADGQRAAGDWCFYDPWGQQYGIILDTNGDGRIDLSGIYSDFAGVDPTTGKAPQRRAGAFSMGKDKMLGTKGDRLYRRGSEVSDDVISWE